MVRETKLGNGTSWGWSGGDEKADEKGEVDEKPSAAG